MDTPPWRRAFPEAIRAEPLRRPRSVEDGRGYRRSEGLRPTPLHRRLAHGAVAQRRGHADARRRTARRTWAAEGPRDGPSSGPVLEASTRDGKSRRRRSRGPPGDGCSRRAPRRSVGAARTFLVGLVLPWGLRGLGAVGPADVELLAVEADRPSGRVEEAMVVGAGRAAQVAQSVGPPRVQWGCGGRRTSRGGRPQRGNGSPGRARRARGVAGGRVALGSAYVDGDSARPVTTRLTVVSHSRRWTSSRCIGPPELPVGTARPAGA